MTEQAHLRDTERWIASIRLGAVAFAVRPVLVWGVVGVIVTEVTTGAEF